MRSRLVAPLLLCLCSLLLVSPGGGALGATQRAVPATPVQLKVMVFNIEVGGTLVSFDKVVEAIQASGADVVGIEEAQGHMAALARELGWPYFSTRLQIVSKYPLIDPPGSQGLYTFVQLAPGAVVAIENVHLPSDPYGPYWVRDGKTVKQVVAMEKRVRLPAIQAQLGLLPSLLGGGIPVFLTGDFNAPSWRDWTAAMVGERFQIKYPVAWPVSLAVEAAGFHDSFRDVHPDPVADPGLTWWAKKPKVAVSGENFGSRDPRDRIDLVYAAGAATTTASQIVAEASDPAASFTVTPWPSDHRGVVSTFDVTPAAPPVLVAVDRRLVKVGDQLNVTFHSSGGPAESVAIVAAGGDPAAPAAEQATGAGAPTDGTLSFATDDLEPGAYAVVLLDANDAVLSRSKFWVKTSTAIAHVWTAKGVYRVGEPITVRWKQAPGNRWDWVAVYQRGANPNVAWYMLWGYTRASIAGQAILDRTPPSFGYGPQPWPLAAGNYSVYLLRDDGYHVLARNVFRVIR
jgi:hypothetical protein